MSDDYRKDIPEITMFCIFHYIEPSSDTYLGYIGNPVMSREENGHVAYHCVEPPVFRKWNFAGTFFAISPIFRPIPNGMKLFCAKKKGGFPYNTISSYIAHDPYNIKDDCVYYITYTRPVPNTVPLYLHKRGENIFPSFNKHPPSNDPQWINEESSPVYVMTADSLGGVTDLHDVQFICINSRSIPYSLTNPMTDVFDIVHPKPRKLSESVLLCQQLGVGVSTKPNDLLDMVSHMSVPKFTLPLLFRQFSPVVIAILIGMFIFLLILLFINIIMKN